MCITEKSNFPQLTHINTLLESTSVHEWRLRLGLCTAVIHRYAHVCHGLNVSQGGRLTPIFLPPMEVEHEHLGGQIVLMVISEKEGANGIIEGWIVLE